MYCRGRNDMNDVAISVEHLSKRYKLYEKPSDRLKEALGRLEKFITRLREEKNK